MKDPLQTKPTPYDILQIPENADLTQINQAFKKMMVSGITDEAKEARQVLCEPVDRAFADIFLYADTYLDQLRPAAKGDAAVLTTKRRNTLEAWRNIEMRLFPNAPSLHSVAVLSYWWAIHAEEECLSTAPGIEVSDAPDPDELWMSVIGNWANITSNMSILKAWSGKREDLNVEKLASKLETHFKNLFENYAKRYRDAGMEERSKAFQGFALKFITEVNTGRSLFMHKIKVNKGGESIYSCGGKIFLKSVGLLDATLEELKKALDKDPANESLKALAVNLSEYGEIAVLMQNKDFDAAISLIEQLPQAQQDEGEVIRLQVQAYTEKGRIHFQTNQYDEAFRLWGKASKLCGLDKRRTPDSMKSIKTVPSGIPSFTESEPSPLDSLSMLESLINDPNERIVVGVLLVMDGIYTPEDELVMMLAATVLRKLSSMNQRKIIKLIPNAAVRNRLSRDLGIS